MYGFKVGDDFCLEAKITVDIGVCWSPFLSARIFMKSCIKNTNGFTRV